MFTRESTRIQQQERLDMVISQMERDLPGRRRRRRRMPGPPKKPMPPKPALEAQRASLDKLRQLKADGRIVLNLHPNDETVDAIPDIPLEDGDQFYVPSRPIVVSVVGDVYNQGSFIQRPGKTVGTLSARCRRTNAQCRQEQDLRRAAPMVRWLAKTPPGASGRAVSTAWC